ncbi:FliM/FliN family flagellar motor switch protein [Pararhizobium sp.]|uniref:FliM/FliN family flagellar motor switch protein n=1 Tax=Pararhizobium sp. TaxID=1977563 RepID=UPI002715DAA3|nr:FliM/FliN family flagellar motor switch protein [Pararhizobium sp.]MDO9416072.1 FliM/FliN family flagellar motor switch protein [Pararhizobium sp.]
MSKALSLPGSAIDPKLLARMTGALGDRETIGKLCAEIGQVMADFLPDIFRNETDLDIAIAYAGFDVGLKNDLIRDFGDGVVLSDASLRNWCPDFTLACDSPVIIAIMEALLGAVAKSIEEPEPRSLSAIELDVATMILDKIADVLRSAVSTSGGFELVMQRPYNAEDKAKPDPAIADVHAASVNMTIGFGPALSTFSIVIPQKALLKTIVKSPRSSGQSRKAGSEWSDHLREQIQRSHVSVEARIRLETMTLNTISRLQPGDVIAFQDATDVRVEVNGNGRELYVCEFGRSGTRYTVRVKETYGTDTDILDHLMG